MADLQIWIESTAEHSTEAQLLAELHGAAVIGREPDAPGVTVANTAISRNHMLLLPFGRHWLAKDLGSTNGSWLRGRAAKAERWLIIRSGDLLQLADTVLRVVVPGAREGFDSQEASSVLVFRGDEIVQEFPVPEYGRVLMIGGVNGDLDIPGSLVNAPGLVIEKLGIDVIAKAPSPDLPVVVNGAPLSAELVLSDQDELKLGDYTVIFNHPKGALPAESSQSSATGTFSQSRGLRDWEEERGQQKQIGLSRPPMNPRFGAAIPRESEEMNETVMLDPRAINRALSGQRGPGGMPSQRGAGSMYSSQPEARSHWSVFEDRLVLVILVILMLAVLVALIWFLIGR